MRSRALLALGALLLGATAGCTEDQAAEETPPIPQFTQPTDLPSQPETGSSPTDRNRPPQVRRTVAEGLEVPWGVAFLPDGDAVVTERESARVVRVSPDGTLAPLGTLAESRAQGEAGLLGVAVSPDFATDSTVFFYLTSATDNRVVAASLEGDRLGAPRVVLDGIPAGFIHDGGRIAFGPDGFLYVTTGETGEPELAQDPASLAGKILRITPEGDPAPGNPDPDSPVYSLGHRNVQGLAWDEQGRLWASEFGASTWDELNLITPGGNYGWPEVEGASGKPQLVDPELVWPVEDASPSGLAYADGSLWMAALRGQRLWRIDLGDGGAATPQAFLRGEYGRLRTVVTTPEGRLWVTTSNRDGRGDPAPDDDRIIEVQP